MQTAREKAKSARSLVCLLQSLVNRKTALELRDDSTVSGTITSVDGFMNVELKQVTVKKPTCLSSDSFTESQYEYYFIKGPRIRFVEIPDDVDPIKAIEGQIKAIRRAYESRVANIRNPEQSLNSRECPKTTEASDANLPQQSSTSAD